MDTDLLTSMWAPLTALLQVVLIDLTLAGDNAVVVGLAVSGLPAHQKRPAILVGIGAATMQRFMAEGAIDELAHLAGRDPHCDPSQIRSARRDPGHGRREG